jgi:hypothetical protein
MITENMQRLAGISITEAKLVTAQLNGYDDEYIIFRADKEDWFLPRDKAPKGSRTDKELDAKLGYNFKLDVDTSKGNLVKKFYENITEAKYNKNSLAKLARNKKDGIEILVDGRWYSVNSDGIEKDIVWGIDQDGGEHEISHKDIEDVNESQSLTEAEVSEKDLENDKKDFLKAIKDASKLTQELTKKPYAGIRGLEDAKDLQKILKIASKNNNVYELASVLRRTFSVFSDYQVALDERPEDQHLSSRQFWNMINRLNEWKKAQDALYPTDHRYSHSGEAFDADKATKKLFNSNGVNVFFS